MVAVNRINPENGFLRDFVEFRDRVKSLESKPAGNIAIRQTLTTEDPVSGVQTVIGQLPDGSYGFQPFIGDTEPPPVASIPLVAAQPGSFVVSWDGRFVGDLEAPRDFVHVNVIGHKIESGIETLATTVGVIRLLTETVIVGTDVATPGETWKFSLESQDYNGNRAALSNKSTTYTMLGLSDDSNISAALAKAQADADAAKTAAANAQTAAGTAQTAADQAKADAASAAGIANSKGKVLTQSAAPAVADQNSSTLWIDTTSGANTPKRWDGSAWVAVTDKAATDAATAAAAAQSKADQAFNNAASAATAAGNAQTSADSKNRIWYQNTAPAGTSHKQNDSWFDTGNDNRLSKWNATTNTWDLSLIGNSAIFPNIDAGKMTVGTLDAARIGAKSIEVGKLTITSTDNLIVGADMSASASSWQKTASILAQATAGRGSTPALRFTGLSGQQASMNTPNRVTVEPDNRFRCSIFVKSSTALAIDRVRLMIRCYTTATAYTDVIGVYNTTALVANTWTQVKGISAVLAANTIAVEFYLLVTNPDTTTITDIDYVSVTRAADGNLVLDGAMDAKSITGAIIQTASSGARIVLDQSTLNAWNSAGDNYFSMSPTTGVNISMVGQYGYDVTAVNKCTNPSFEVDISGWTSPQTIVRDTSGTPGSNTGAWAGSACLKATHTATADRTVSRIQTQDPNPFGAANFSAYVRHNSATAKSIKAEFVWTDASDVAIANETYTSTTTVQPNTWTRIQVATNLSGSPLASSKMRMSVIGVAFTSAESLWVDAVLLDNMYPISATTPRPYMDGSTTPYGKVEYVWSNPGTSTGSSEERTSRDVKIKTGSNTILKDPTSEAGDGGIAMIQTVDAPGVGFILPRALTQPAGLFSDGTKISIIEGTGSGSRIARVTVGNSEVFAYSGGISTYKSYGTMNIQSQNSSVFISGSAVNLNGVDMKTRRAEFNNNGAFSVNAGTLWDIGALTIDTNTKKTVNNSFVNPSATPGAITILEEGYYMFYVIVIPNSNPGPAWLRLYRASDNERLFQVNNGSGYAYETSGSTIPVYISANDTVRTMYQATNAHTINAKLKVVKVNYS